MIVVYECDFRTVTRTLVPVLFVPCNGLRQFTVCIDELLGFSDSDIEELSVHPFCFLEKLVLARG